MTPYLFHIAARASTGWLALTCLLCLTLGPASLAALPSDEVARDFQAARRALEDDPEVALELAEKLPTIEHAEDVRLNLLAEAQVRARKVGEATKTLARLARVSEDETEQFRARLDRAELLFLTGELKEAKAAAEELQRLEKSLRAGRRDRAFFHSRLVRLRHDLALVEEGGKAGKTAKRLARELLLDYPTLDATLREGLALEVGDLSDRDRYRRALQLMDSWGYEEARDEFERLEKHPRYGETARWNLGLIALRKLRDDAKQAEQIFTELAKGGRYAEEALWYVARSQMRQERYDDALKTIDRYAEKYPRGKHTLDVYYYRGWLPYDHRQNEKAIPGFEAFIDRYGRRSYKSSYIYGFRAWAYMRMGAWEEAIEAWEEMLPFGNTLVAGKALYWMAYAHRELGQKDKALAALAKLRDRYPISYYGMLGEQLRAEIEGKDRRASKVWWPEGGGSLDDSPRIDVVGRSFERLSDWEAQRWERVKTLALLGEKHLAREELEPIDEDLLAEIPRDRRDAWIHALGRFVGDYNTMWDEAAGSISALPGLPDPDALRSAMAYPRAYREIVDEVAEEFELPSHLIWSIMRQESRYKPGAISYTDAVGALQMIPKTARLVARDLGTVYDVRTFFRPEVGFRYSGFYMRKLLDTFDGLYVPMATSYNSGPEIVAHWFRQNPDASFPWLIEEFAYNEGRAYGRKIAEHMLRYLYLYEPDEAERARIVDALFPLSRDIDVPDDVGY